MTYQAIGLGTTVGDGTGDTIRAGGDKVNDNFVEIYSLLGTGTALTSGISATATVVTLAGPSITGVASFADGSNTAPSITNTGDTNTGIYFGAADTVNITTGGTKRIEIDSSGLDVTGDVTATTFVGALTGNVTGNVTGTAATVTTAAQSAITSLGTLTALTVDNIIVDGTNIGHTSDTDSIAIAANGVVTFSQIPVLPANSIDSDYYVDGSIDTAHIADNQITLAKMAGIARGKIIYGDASGDPAVLTAGSNGQVLTSDGTDISWAAAGLATVTDSTANTNFPVVFHNESNALLDDTGALRYNPSTGTLLVPNRVVAGTTTQVDTVTMEAANAIVFEGATADAYETTLTITDPTADRTITLPDATGTVALTSISITWDRGA